MILLRSHSKTNPGVRIASGTMCVHSADPCGIQESLRVKKEVEAHFQTKLSGTFKDKKGTIGRRQNKIFQFLLSSSV